ncbi:hypothetical protein [Saccharopolyspora spinosa]|uniref:hypothetical protein n=1 Tax=Saccharopolyspora spinosa TaxID=60894 RepID=UPI00117B83D5|nr:hypothetical protein [Saccharopolyspora spinosa]
MVTALVLLGMAGALGLVFLAHRARTRGSGADAPDRLTVAELIQRIAKETSGDREGRHAVHSRDTERPHTGRDAVGEFATDEIPIPVQRDKTEIIVLPLARRRYVPVPLVPQTRKDHR